MEDMNEFELLYWKFQNGIRCMGAKYVDAQQQQQWQHENWIKIWKLCSEYFYKIPYHLGGRGRYEKSQKKHKFLLFKAFIKYNYAKFIACKSIGAKKIQYQRLMKSPYYSFGTWNYIFREYLKRNKRIFIFGCTMDTFQYVCCHLYCKCSFNWLISLIYFRFFFYRYHCGLNKIDSNFCYG